MLAAADGVDPDYVAAVEPGSFAEQIPAHADAVLLLVAARVQGTRLIDNILVRVSGDRRRLGGAGNGGGG